MNAVRSESKQFFGLGDSKCPGLGPGITDQAVKIGFSVLAGPLAMWMFVNEFGIMAWVIIVKNINPDDNLHSAFVALANEDFGRIEILDDFRIFFVQIRI